MVLTTVLLTIAATAVALAITWWFSVSGQLYRLKSIPSPADGSILLGHVNSPGDSLYTDAGASWLRKWGKTYPELFRVRLGLFNFILTSHPKCIRALFKEKPEKTWLYRYAIKWIGDGLLFSKGKKWFKRRKLLTPSFHFDLLKSYVDIFNETTNTLTDQLRAQGGQQIEMFPKALSLTLDTILRCLLHYESNCQTQQDEYAQLMYRLSEITISRVFSPTKQFDHLYHKTAEGAEYLDLRQKFQEKSRKIVDDRREVIRNNPDILKDAKNRSFLDVLLTARLDDGTDLSTEDVLEEANVFIFEGHDTTASGISWSLFELALRPEHQEKCYQEIKEAFDREQGDKYVTQQQINQLPYFSMCIKECMRLRSPVPYIGRNLDYEIEMGGHRLPANSNIMVLIDALHRLEEYWPEPDKFDPQRFNQENSKNRDPYSYIPFSAGNRNCIGQNFAITELKMAVAKILYNFEVLPSEPETVTRLNALIQKPINMFLKFVPRETANMS